MFGAFTGFVQGRAPLKGAVYGRPTRGSPLLQGMPLLENSPPDCFWKFGEADFPIHPMRSALRWGFRALRSATIGASRPPRPPRQSSRALQPHFWIGDSLSFGKGNKVGSWRSQLLGNRRSRLSTRRCIPRFLFSRRSIERAITVAPRLFFCLDFIFCLRLQGLIQLLQSLQIRYRLRHRAPAKKLL